jgi:hypothetical protein
MRERERERVKRFFFIQKRKKGFEKPKKRSSYKAQTHTWINEYDIMLAICMEFLNKGTPIC